MPTVLVVDDSPTAREVLAGILGSDPTMQVVGFAKDGREAVEMAKRLLPDVITMDINMPVMNGFEATIEIMIEAPTRIVIISASSRVSEVETAMRALRAGALTVLSKPAGPHAPNFAARAKEIASTVKAMADVVVVRRRRAAPRTRPPATAPPPAKMESRLQAIAIAVSTGGPPALATLLGGLPADFPVPILIVQHIAAGFVEGFARWLGGAVALNVKIAADHERIVGGTVYIAPHDAHLGVTRSQRILLSDDPAIEGFRPAGTYLFNSVSKAFSPDVAAVILTGMGRDGVAGLKVLHDAGGITIAQDEATSVVYGMPKVATQQGVIDTVLPIDAIAPHLMQLINPNSAQGSR